MSVHEITIIQHILASPFQVYGAFTTSEGWCAWCCETAESDAVIGGKLHIYTDGYNAYGEYSVLEPGRAIAFTWDGDKEPPMRVNILLVEQDNGTQVTFTVTVINSNIDNVAFLDFLERVWGRALNNLKAVLESNP